MRRTLTGFVMLALGTGLCLFAALLWHHLQVAGPGAAATVVWLPLATLASSTPSRWLAGLLLAGAFLLLAAVRLLRRPID